jgi:transcriptional regulator GlxA family with amidase domain
MATYKKSGTPRDSSSSRRIIVIVVPPVDELDLVGPLQVFNSVNRLAGRKIYAIEVVTNAERLIVEGESGVGASGLRTGQSISTRRSPL